ncbi:MAG: oligogalacturonate lyase family protein [Candidatus Solibacter sp.]
MLISALASAALWGEGRKGETFPSESTRYPDPLTEIEVYRLSSPDYSTTLTAWYNRGIARNSNWMLCGCDRTGSVQGFRLELKTGEMRQVTEVEGLDASTLTLLPDNRSFCFVAGRSLYVANASTFKERVLYEAPDGWDFAGGMSVGPDGTHATVIERKGEASRIRMVTLVQGAARTVVEAPFAMSAPISRPMRAQMIYRQGYEALWMVNSDGSQNRKLKLAPGGVGTPDWSFDGKTILYLNFPEDKRQLNALREFTPDTGTDKLIGKTSQFVSFGVNRDASVFVGASRNTSPAVLLFVRSGHSERTMCEHKASNPEAVAPEFSPDSQRIYFQSDRHGKPAIYGMHVDKLVEKTESPL